MPAATIYRLHQSYVADDGTVVLSASVYDDHSHSLVMAGLTPADEDYPFWRWALGQKRYAKILDEEAITHARSEYDRFCQWRDGLGSTTPYRA